MEQRKITNQMIAEFELELRNDEKSELTVEKYLRDVRHMAAFLSEKQIEKPLISLGITSGVNWILLKLNPKAFPIVFTKRVLASPGTPTSNTCPWQKIERMVL